jgi:hypothetical protein
MNIFEYIQRSFAGLRRTVDSTMKDMTAELFNWAPPGTANTISATFVHFMHTEDRFIHSIIQDKATIWESGEWSSKTGIQKPPEIGEDWSGFKKMKVNLQLLQEYKAAVWAATDTYLAGLTQEELDRMVKFANGERTVAEMLMLAVSQAHGHMGEIAALKGIQGVKGLAI